MSNTQFVALEQIAGFSANLLGASLTFLALIPTLVELIRIRAPTFVFRLEKEVALDRVILALAVTVVLYSVTLGCGLLGDFSKWVGLVWIAITAFGISLLILIIICFYTALTIRNFK